MSLIIFFGFSFCVFTAGLIVISLTFLHWYKIAQDGKYEKSQKQSSS